MTDEVTVIYGDISDEPFEWVFGEENVSISCKYVVEECEGCGLVIPAYTVNDDGICRSCFSSWIFGW